MQPDTHASNSGAVRRHTLLLAIARGIGKLKHQSVRIGCHYNRGLYRYTERDFDANILSRIDDLHLLDVRRRKGLTY